MGMQISPESSSSLCTKSYGETHSLVERLFSLTLFVEIKDLLKRVVHSFFSSYPTHLAGAESSEHSPNTPSPVLSPRNAAPQRKKVAFSALQNLAETALSSDQPYGLTLFVEINELIKRGVHLLFSEHKTVHTPPPSIGTLSIYVSPFVDGNLPPSSRRRTPSNKVKESTSQQTENVSTSPNVTRKLSPEFEMVANASGSHHDEETDKEKFEKLQHELHQVRQKVAETSARLNHIQSPRKGINTGSLIKLLVITSICCVFYLMIHNTEDPRFPHRPHIA